MQAINRFFKALFNFIVGDWIILGGVAVSLLFVAIVVNLSNSESLKQLGGFLLILGLILTLVVTLRRETR